MTIVAPWKACQAGQSTHLQATNRQMNKIMLTYACPPDKTNQAKQAGVMTGMSEPFVLVALATQYTRIAGLSLAATLRLDRTRATS